MRGSPTWQLEPEWTPLSDKSPVETLEPTYLRSYLSKEPLTPSFDPKAYSSAPSRPLPQELPNPRRSGQQRSEFEQGQTRDPHERPRGSQPYAPSPSIPLLPPSAPQPASSNEISLLIDRLGSLDSSIRSMQQRLDEHERRTEQAEAALQKHITSMLDQREKELLSAMEERIRVTADSFQDAVGDDGVGERVLGHVVQLGQEAREAHVELHEDLEELSSRTEKFEKSYLGGLKELKDEMNGSKTEIDRLRSVVSQQSQMLGLLVEQHRTSMTQLTTLQVCMNSCLGERRDSSRSHQDFGVARMLSPPADTAPFDATVSQETTATFISPTCTRILDRLDPSQSQYESRDQGQLSEGARLMLTPAGSAAPSEPEEAAEEPVKPTAREKLTKVSVTYATQDEGSVTDVIHVARAMPSPAKKPKRSTRRSLRPQAGWALTAQRHRSTVPATARKTKRPQDARAPVMGRRTRLQDRKQQEQLDSNDRELTSLLSGPVHLTRAKRTFLHMENTHLDLDAIARRGLPFC